MKALQVLVLLFYVNIIFACDCFYVPFCNNWEPEEEPNVIMIEKPNTFYYPDSNSNKKYYDVKIIDQLFGFPLDMDSLTIVDAASSCDPSIATYADTLLIKFSSLEKESPANVSAASRVRP